MSPLRVHLTINLQDGGDGFHEGHPRRVHRSSPSKTHRGRRTLRLRSSRDASHRLAALSDLGIEHLCGILYDMDGVLIHSAEAWFRVLARACSHFGRPPIPRDLFRQTFGQGIEADRRLFFPNREAAEIATFYDVTFPLEIDAVRVASGARDVLSHARSLGIRQAVVTNAPRAVALCILHHKGLDRYLDACVAAGDALEKPAPDLVLLALSRLDLRPDQALYVGDTRTDAAAARDAGVAMAGIGTAGDVTIDSLKDLLALLGRGKAP